MAELISLHRAQKPSLLASSGRRSVPKPTREQPIIISASELRDFLRCRVKWWWRHQCRLEPTTGSEALALGSLVHNVLEQFYAAPLEKRTVKRMTKLAQTMCRSVTVTQLSSEARQLAEAMLIGYAAWAKKEDEAIGLVRCIPEQKFLIPLGPTGLILVKGRIDAVFESAVHRKTMGNVEFKTAGQFKHNIVEQNLQLTIYLWALSKLYPGFKRYESYYTQLRKQMPGPRVKADLFMRDDPVSRTADEIRQWEIDTANAVLDMHDAAIYPTPDDSCSWACDYQRPCLERGNPADLKHILATGYKQKEYRP